MLITLATDMALKRQQYQTQLFNRLIDSIQYQLFMQKVDDAERIVNKDGKVVSKWVPA